ncbi:hypothetical protein GMORB2_6575 [Geosmithia morbida]|uniref:Uncharacterized protein n=1 Tax=Geosmithia morbida TaxID=1094350 RepID=A0A9P4YUZ9_9HYPO|nr:uncharacterized protein GMORB2_6575 [Geosmithia morbida]KAF4123027.1 hypothetical protein GMORB2_6575 [Geosmithia morbida]
MAMETDPLLGKDDPPPPLSRLQRFAITFFSLVRLLRGLCFIAWPAILLSSFEIPQNGASFMLGSLLGSRDLLLGGLLYTADMLSIREVSRALVTNLLSDAMDTFILIFSAACSWHWKNPFIEIGISALLAFLEHLTLYSMSEDDTESPVASYEAGMQAAEDKNRRLGTWLSELRMAEMQQQDRQSLRPESAFAPSSIV